MMAQNEPMKRPTLSQHLLELSDDARLPEEVRTKLRHASHRAKRKDDELEVARVKLHNLDFQDCARCGEWYGIEALTDDVCKECLAALREDAYEDRQITNRIARGGWLPREVGT